MSTENNQAQTVRYFATFSLYSATSSLKLSAKGTTRITLEGGEQRDLAEAIMLTAGREMDFIAAHKGVAEDGKTYDFRDEWTLKAELSAPLSTFVSNIHALPQEHIGFAQAHGADVNFEGLAAAVIGWVRMPVTQRRVSTSLIPDTAKTAKSQSKSAVLNSSL